MILDVRGALKAARCATNVWLLITTASLMSFQYTVLTIRQGLTCAAVQAFKGLQTQFRHAPAICVAANCEFADI